MDTPDGATPTSPKGPTAPASSADAGGSSGETVNTPIPGDATSVTPSAAPPGTSEKSGDSPADTTSELVRVAKAERRAALAMKSVEQKTAALAQVEAKEAKFNTLVAEGKLLDATRVYFPDDNVLAQKLFWQLNDFVLNLPNEETQPKTLTVEEQVAKALEGQRAAEKKAADDKAEADKSAETQKVDQALEQERAKYFDDARQALAANPNAYPLVAAKIIAGKISQDQIIGHAEAIAAEVFKLPGLTREQQLERAAAETDPELVFAAMEQVLRGETAPAAATAAPDGVDDVLAAIAAAEQARSRPAPMVTISSSSVRGAPTVVHKQPDEMTLDELTDWAIAEAQRSRGNPAAR